jgi:hypothetical protein
MEAGCRDCESDQEHCHGTVIVHALRRSECTEDGCTSPELFTHVFVIDCDAVGCDCLRLVEESAHRVG